MKKTNFIKKAIPVIALSVLFGSCSFDTGSNKSMTGTQTETYSGEDPILVKSNTGKLVLSGAKGKTIYMSRINSSNEKLKTSQIRYAKILSSARTLADDSVTENYQIASDEVSEDPHKKLYDAFIKEFKGLQTSSARAAAIPSVENNVKEYKVGDIETFNILDPDSIGSEKQTWKTDQEFKLLVSDTKERYYIWVKADDTYYTSNESDFQTKAEELGTKFINGYEVVSHIYGEPSKYLYTNTARYEMETASKTGKRINIMLYPMLSGGVYGFVYHGDVFYAADNSNLGRFLYMDSQTLMEDTKNAWSTALHEFSHTISFNVKTIENNKEWTYWYGELLAMTCEDMMQEYLGLEDDNYEDLCGTPKGRLVQGNFIAGLTGCTGQSGEMYAAVFMFGSWLARKFGGVKFVKELATNPYVDMESILKAVNTVNETSYTADSLLTEYAGDLLEEKAGFGHNQDAKTYSGSEEYTCSYMDGSGNSQVYNYPFTAINLWDPFYAWYYGVFDKDKNLITGFDELVSNKLLSGAEELAIIPEENPAIKIIKEYNKALLGPLMLKKGTIAFCNSEGTAIGPYSFMLANLGTAEDDEITIEFKCEGNSFSDVVNIWVR